MDGWIKVEKDRLLCGQMDWVDEESTISGGWMDETSRYEEIKYEKRLLRKENIVSDQLIM